MRLCSSPSGCVRTPSRWSTIRCTDWHKSASTLIAPRRRPEIPSVLKTLARGQAHGYVIVGDIAMTLRSCKFAATGRLLYSESLSRVDARALGPDEWLGH